MKKIFYLSLIAILLEVGSCKKKGNNINPLSDVTQLGIGAYLVLDSTLSVTMVPTDASSSVGVMVEEYKGGQAIDHIDVFTNAGAPTSDTTKWHRVKSVSYTGKGTTVSVSGEDLATAYGTTPANVAPGSYTFYNRAVTKDGEYWDYNNTGTANDATNLIAGAAYHSSFYFSAYVLCVFMPPMAGTYQVLEDDWADWGSGDLVTVTDGPGSNELNLSQVYPNPAYGVVVDPLVIDVDPATGIVTIPSGITFANYTCCGYTASTGSGSSGYVFSCTGLITLNIHLLATGYGDQGFLKLILQKQ